MDKKGDSGDLLKNYVIFLIILVLFTVGMLYFIFQYRAGAGVWGDYYVKEIVKSIDFSSAGDEIWLDVQKGVSIALGNEISRGDIFSLDNLSNEICVKLSKGRKTCFNYFNDVDIVDLDLKIVGDEGKNVLYFRIVDVQREGGGKLDE